MEKLTINENLHQQRSSQVGHTDRISQIDEAKALALGDVFDRWRLNQGWNPWDNDTQMAAIQSWVTTLDRESIPADAYHELYERVLQRRASAVQNGSNIPSFGVELLLAEWIGEHGLRNERRRQAIQEGRTLPATARSNCQKCYGSGWEIIEGQGARRCECCAV